MQKFDLTDPIKAETALLAAFDASSGTGKAEFGLALFVLYWEYGHNAQAKKILDLARQLLGTFPESRQAMQQALIDHRVTWETSGFLDHGVIEGLLYECLRSSWVETAFDFYRLQRTTGENAKALKSLAIIKNDLEKHHPDHAWLTDIRLQEKEFAAAGESLP